MEFSTLLEKNDEHESLFFVQHLFWQEPSLLQARQGLGDRRFLRRSDGALLKSLRIAGKVHQKSQSLDQFLTPTNNEGKASFLRSSVG
jgi:hypothetical protein